MNDQEMEYTLVLLRTLRLRNRLRVSLPLADSAKACVVFAVS